MILEVDNKEAVDLSNNYSVGGRARHGNKAILSARVEVTRGYVS